MTDWLAVGIAGLALLVSGFNTYTLNKRKTPRVEMVGYWDLPRDVPQASKGPGSPATAGGRLDRDGEAGGVDETEGRWDRRPVSEQCQFGRSGAIVGDTEHPVADSYVGNTSSDLVDHARYVATRRLRQPRAKVQQALAQLRIGRTDAGRMHDDPNLPRAGMRVRNVYDLEDLGASEPAELCCFIVFLPFDASCAPFNSVSCSDSSIDVAGGRHAPFATSKPSAWPGSDRHRERAFRSRTGGAGFG